MGDFMMDKRMELMGLQVSTFGKLTSCCDDIRKSALLRNLLTSVQKEQLSWQVAHIKAHEEMRKLNNSKK